MGSDPRAIVRDGYDALGPRYLEWTLSVDPGGVDNWVDGVQMYWSGFDAETNLGLVRDAGFDLAASEVLQNFEDGKDVHFLWAIGRKPV